MRQSGGSFVVGDVLFINRPIHELHMYSIASPHACMNYNAKHDAKGLYIVLHFDT